MDGQKLSTLNEQFISLQLYYHCYYYLTLKNCDKTFLKNILRLLKTDDVSKLAKRHYQVKKSICEWQSISTKITMSDKKPYCEEITIVIKRKVWHVWSPSGYLNQV